ncbi:Hypothetical_protein [Hexamita inflata]|uniref:Hypothetical_protein n=1 Tax=Hexamita inflata TaxID=28002 RepID=A0AA86QWN4_9EUKA|nr:Hypothetical protein HINF_LOCUS48788 [Hexamita inflata]
MVGDPPCGVPGGGQQREVLSGGKRVRDVHEEAVGFLHRPRREVQPEDDRVVEEHHREVWELVFQLGLGAVHQVRAGLWVLHSLVFQLADEVGQFSKYIINYYCQTIVNIFHCCSSCCSSCF